MALADNHIKRGSAYIERIKSYNKRGSDCLDLIKKMDALPSGESLSPEDELLLVDILDQKKYSHQVNFITNPPSFSFLSLSHSANFELNRSNINPILLSTLPLHHEFLNNLLPNDVRVVS
jgi:hypothetical protein